MTENRKVILLGGKRKNKSYKFYDEPNTPTKKKMQ